MSDRRGFISSMAGAILAGMGVRALAGSDERAEATATGKEFLDAVKGKKLIRSIQYKMDHFAEFYDPSADRGPDKEPDYNRKLEVYYHEGKLKIITYFPTEDSPQEYKGKNTIVIAGDMIKEKTEVSDNAIPPRLNQKKMDRPLGMYLSRGLRDCLALPDSKTLFHGIKKFKNKGESLAEFHQGNHKLLFSFNKAAILKDEYFEAPDRKGEESEYSNFVDVSGFQLPTRVMIRKFKAGKLVQVIRREMHDIRVNEAIEEVFDV